MNDYSKEFGMYYTLQTNQPSPATNQSTLRNLSISKQEELDKNKKKERAQKTKLNYLLQIIRYTSKNKAPIEDWMKIGRKVQVNT